MGDSPADSHGPLDAALAAKLAGTRLLALDVDGVLTAGAVVYAGEAEVQSFFVQDGQGLVWLAREGVVVAWITGRGSEATRRRAQELGVTELHMQSGPKGPVLADIQERLGIARAETVAMGDDVPDLALATRAGTFAAPANARSEVKERADLVTRASGGAGAVREIVERILTAKGRWRAILEAAAS